MLTLGCYIVFSNPDGKRYLEFTSVNSVEIESTWKKLTDTCKITLPRKLKVLNGNINDVIKRGSKVSVWLGYDGKLSLEFIGYVARQDARVPFVIECENEMWKLKQNNISKTYRSVSLSQLIKDIYPGKANVTDFTLGAYRIDRASTAIALEDLQKNYNVFSYFSFDDQGNLTLNVGLGGYDFKQVSTRHIYNMLVNIIENDLIFRLSEENKLRVVATSTNKGGIIIRSEPRENDPEGEEIKIEKRGLTKAALDKLALAELNKRKFDGYKGSFTAFGLPKAKHNEIAVIQSPEYPERDGAYMIDTVKQTYGINGYRRVIELGVKVG